MNNPLMRRPHPAAYGAVPNALRGNHDRLRSPPKAAPAEGRPEGAAAPMPRGGHALSDWT
jgi:hypothetical protein